jgi:hypothetical protein
MLHEIGCKLNILQPIGTNEPIRSLEKLSQKPGAKENLKNSKNSIRVTTGIP